MNKSSERNQQRKPKQFLSEVEKMYLPKPGNWPSQHLYLKINTGYNASENPSEETISECSQIRELNQKIKLSN